MTAPWNGMDYLDDNIGEIIENVIVDLFDLL
jgi:hypothetical protein